MHRHVSAPTRFFSQLPNDLIRHPRLSATAVRILIWQLSLPEGADEPLWKTAERAGIGKISFQRAKAQLRAERYLFEWRRQGAGGRWVTVQLVSSTPLSQEEALALVRPGAAPGTTAPGTTPAPATAPSASSPAAGAPTVRPPAPQPRKTPSQNTPHPAGGREAEAETLLLSLGRTVPALAMSTHKAHRWAPLAAAWLAAGIAPDAMRRTLVAGLERARSPLGALRWRLEHALPAPAGPPPEPRVATMRECAGTHTQPRLFRPVADETHCARCTTAVPAPDLAPAPAPAPNRPETGLAAYRAARAALAGRGGGRGVGRGGGRGRAT